MGRDPMAVEFDNIIGDRPPGDKVPAQSDEHDELIKWMDERLRRDLDAKQSHARNWDFFRRMRRGDSVDARHRETGEVIRLSDEDSKKLRSQMNVLHPTARSLVGKLVRVIPGLDVRPGSSDFEETHGARIAKSLIDHGYEDQDAEVRLIEACEHIPDAGNAFLQLSWDAYSGRDRAYCQQCDFSVSDEEMIGELCPNCQIIKQNAETQYQQQLQMVEQQAAAEVMSQMPPGTVFDPAMLPADMPLPERPPDMDIEIPALVRIHEGKPCIIVRDPREVVPEAGARSLHESRYVSVRVPMPVSDARQAYPEHADMIEAESVLWQDETADLRPDILLDGNGTDAFDDHCWVTEMYIKPTERHPHGRVIHRVNNIIVKDLGLDTLSDIPEDEQHDNPYNVLGRFPLYHIGFDRATGEFWFEPGLEHAWHRQAELDRMETTFREWAELWIKPRALIPIGSRIGVDEISAEGEQLIKYNANAGQVVPWPIQAWPPQLVERRNELIGDIRLQMGVTESDAGVSPADPNGRALAIIEAESDQSLGPILKRIHSEWRALWRGYIQLFQKLAPDDYVFTVAGPEGTVTHSFKDMILRAGWDVVLEQDDGLSRNKAVRMQQAADLANLGIYNDQLTGMLDKKQFMKHVGLNLPSAGYDMERSETAAAARIPERIANGEPWQPMPEDDAQIHARELLGWLRGPGRQLVAKNPQLVQQVRQIWVFYAQMVIADMMGGAVPGAPPLAGGGAEPAAAGGSGLGGPDQSAPGGSANGPGHMGSDVRLQAGQTVAQADQTGEAMARPGRKHEG